MRDAKGRFLAGQSGNPGGRPKGASLTARLRARLAQAASDGEGDVADSLVNVLVKSALDGDPAATKLLWNYCEGLPTATLAIEATDWIVPILSPDELAALPSRLPGPVIIDDL